MKTCTFPVEITNRGAQSLRMKMRKCEMDLKGATVILRLVAACSKIARTSVKVRKTKRLALPLVLLRAQKRISEQALQ